jgi:biopolymer transport protein ExbD
MPGLRRKRDSGVLNPNLTPLLDMVLQLITFFMMLIHFGAKLEGSSKGVRLPTAPAALPGRDMAFDRLAASLDARGRLLVDDKPLDEAGARSWWANQAKTRRAGLETLDASTAAADADELPTLVILRADKDVSFGAVRGVLSEAQSRGFAQFSLVLLRRERR